MNQRKLKQLLDAVIVLGGLVLLPACKKEIMPDNSDASAVIIPTGQSSPVNNMDTATFLGRPLHSFSSAELEAYGWEKAKLIRQREKVDQDSSAVGANIYSAPLYVKDLFAMGIGQATIFNRIPVSPVKVGATYPGAAITFFNTDYYQLFNNSLNYPSNSSQFNFDKNWYTANCQSARLNAGNAETATIADVPGSEIYLNAFILDNRTGTTNATMQKSYSVAIANQLSWSATVSAKISQKFKINFLFGETETTAEVGASATGGGQVTTTTTETATATLVVPKGKRGRIAFYKVNRNVTGSYKVPATLSGEIGADYVNSGNYSIYGNVIRKYPASVLMGGQAYQIEKGNIIYNTGDIIAVTSFF